MHRFSDAAYAVAVNGVVVANLTKAAAHTRRNQEARSGALAVVWHDRRPPGSVLLSARCRQELARRGLPIPVEH